MRVAYLDCFAGIAGDMFLGALLDAGVPAQVLHEAVAGLHLNAMLTIESVDRSGITSTKVHVLEAGQHAEKKNPPHEHTHPHEHDHEHPHVHEHAPHGKDAEHQHGPATSRLDAPAKKKKHESKDKHGTTHEHAHHRSLPQIRSLIQAAPLDDAVKRFAIRTFNMLAESEAKIHGIPLEHVHFHEVGAVDAIVDIVAATVGMHHLGIEEWHSSPINVGSGTVNCAHGAFPVPAPATADLLRGFPTYSAHIEKELTTPTGAALLRALAPVFGGQPLMRVESIGYGAGSRNPGKFPNVLRLSIGTRSEATNAPESITNRASDAQGAHPHQGESVAVLETALDDLSPQLLAHTVEQALAHGALDAMLTPVIMKKGRPGTLMTLLCNPSDAARLQALLVRETSTLGVRIRHDRRLCLDRSYRTVQTSFGDIRIKIGSSDGEERNAAPEFEDCRAAAAQHGVAVKQVQQAAIAAYLR